MNSSLGRIITLEKSIKNFKMFRQISNHGIERARRFAKNMTEKFDDLFATLEGKLKKVYLTSNSIASR